MANEDIKDIFKDNIGHRCQFRHYLNKWLNNINEANEEHVPLLKKINEETVLKSETDTLTLTQILNDTAKGQIVLKADKSKELDDGNRKRLLECIVDYFNNCNKCLSKDEIVKYTDQIHELYPKEIKVILVVFINLLMII